MVISIYSDGASRGNPGDAAIGVSLIKDNVEFDSISKKIGKKTNNQAEYEAVIAGLEKISHIGEEVDIFVDSQLVAKQLRGEYKVKSSLVKPLYEKVLELSKSISIREIVWIPREENKRADELANNALNTI